MIGQLVDFLLGRPLPTSAAIHERLTKVKALAVFSSDALSSTAYATEEIILALLVAGSGVLGLSWPIAIGIAILLVIVSISYRQTIHAYPTGGGSYIVAKDNLGQFPGLVAGSALLIDYVLTVAVSVSAGVAALTSAVPDLQPYRVSLCLTFVLLITLANMRGIRESGSIFALPTYMFIVSMAALMLMGIYRMVSGVGAVETAPIEAVMPTQALSLFLILRAFASGCTALTGIEAISDGVPAFKKPEANNAATTLTWMVTILVTLFLGITYLATHYAIHPLHPEEPGYQTVVSQIARAVFGVGPIYYVIQASTALILVLAANTAYADFPRLSSIIARDRFLPRQFTNIGHRLAFSNGILVLGLLSSLLIVVFQGYTHSLIPLYAVGVFISFTLSQAGMVVRWWRRREPGWRHFIAINAIGATATGIVLVVIAATKFLLGAWIVILLIPTFVLMFLRIHGHYVHVAEQLRLKGWTPPAPATHNTVIVPVGDIHRGVVQALRYASLLSNDVRAIHIEVDPARTERLRSRWGEWGQGVKLILVPSPYRSTLSTLIQYLHEVDTERDDDVITVVLPEFVPRHWWENLLHNQTSWILNTALRFQRNKVVVAVRYQLDE
ncbi:MAG: APC family permease [Anaerolineae bacterium]|nr:APC family permease [Anaerolineae bacterium]